MSVVRLRFEFMSILKILLYCLLSSVTSVTLAQERWTIASYPDELGFKERTEGMLLRLSNGIQKQRDKL